MKGVTSWALLGVVLLLVGAGAADTADTATCTCETDPTCKMNPLKPTKASNMKITLDLVWVVWNFGLALFWIYQLVQLRKNKKEFTGPAKAAFVAAFMEGIFFTFRTVMNITAYPWIVYPWGMALQMFNGASLWLMAFFWSRVGMKWTAKQVVMRLAGLLIVATVFALAVIGIMNKYGDDPAGLEWIKPIFLSWFEPPQLLILAFAAAAASSYSTPFSPPSMFAAGLLILWMAHMISMYIMGKAPCLMERFYPVYIPMQLIGSAIAAAGLTKSLNTGVFETDTRARDIVLKHCNLKHEVLQAARQEREDAIEAGTATPTHVWSPEIIYSVGVIFVLIGYVLSGASMALITKPDLNKDPVYRLYETFHPCILLDYLPGTIFAQPMFGAGILLSQYSMLIGLFRTVAYGDAISTAMQAMLFGWYWLISAFFILVFTFNPTMTKVAPVLLHSVPYMIMNVCNAFFCVTTMIIMCRWKGINGKAVTSLVGTLYTLAIIYGTYFMSGKIMSKHGMNLLEVQDLADPAALDSVSDLEVNFDPTPMVITLIGQAVILSFGLISPLRHRPLAFELLSREKYVPTKYAANQEEELAGELKAAEHPSFSACVAGSRNATCRLLARTPLQVVAAMIPVCFFFARVFDARIWEEDNAVADYREVFKRHPGSAIIAVSWMIAAFFLVMHVFIVVTHEWNTNESVLKYWTAFAGLLLLASALVAHAGTIPSGTLGFTTDWFHGVEAFMVALAIWMLTHVFLALQLLLRVLRGGDYEEDEDEEEAELTCRESILKPMLFAEILVGTAMTLIILLAAAHVHEKYDGLWMLGLFLFSLIDARGVQVIFSAMRVATPVDLMVYDEDKEEWHLPGPVINTISIEEEFETELQDAKGGYMVFGKAAALTADAD